VGVRVYVCVFGLVGCQSDREAVRFPSVAEVCARGWQRCGAVVRALAEGGVEVNGRDSRLSTPLHLVAMRGYADVTLTLLRCVCVCVCVCTCAMEGRRAHGVCMLRRFVVLRVCVCPPVVLCGARHGAHVNSQDMSGVTPLRHAAYRGV
jgi:hypothetical protein